MPEKSNLRQQVTNLLPVLGLLGLILLFVAPALAPNKMLAPLDIVSEAWPPWQKPNQTVTVHNFMLTDVVNYIIPVKQFMADSVRSGEIPLWNPYVFTGYPFTYNTQAGLWYPLSILYYLLPLPTAVDATIILQMFLGAVFMFGYLRQIRLSRSAAFLGSLIFTFNGFMIVWLEWQVVQAAVLWLPGQLWLIERIATQLEREENHSYQTTILAIFSGLLFAIPWLGGHWNWTLFTSLITAVYLLWRLLPLYKTAQGRHQRQRIALPFFLTLALGTAVALIQALPAFFYLSQTHRQPITYAQSLSVSLWDRLVVLVVPNFFGSPTANNWWGPENYNETTFYLGIMPLLLAGTALWLRRDRWGRFFSVGALLGLLWAVRSPLYFPLHLLPVFNGLFPSRAIFLTVLCVPILAALTLDTLQQKKPVTPKRPFLFLLLTASFLIIVSVGYFWVYRLDVQRTWSFLMPQTILAAVFLLAGFTLLAARLANRLPAPLFIGLTLVCVVADLFLFGLNYNSIGSLDNWFGKTAVADFLQSDPTPYRIVTPAESIVYFPNTALVDRIPNVSGYEPGVWQRTSDYLRLAEGEDSIRFGRVLMPLLGLESPLLDAINARYIVTTRNVWGAEPLPGPSQVTAVSQITLGPGQIIRTPLTMPDAGLHRLDLWLQTDEAAAGTVTVRVFTRDGVLELANSSIELGSLPAASWQSFYFSAFPSEWGRDFLFQVEFQGEGAVQLGSNSSGEIAFTTYYLPRPNLAFEEGKSQIYHNPDAFERAYFVPRALVAENKAAAETAVLDHAAELDQIVILEPTNGQVPTELGSAASGTSQVTITRYGLNQVTVTVSNDAPGFLVLADTYYPGWRATVNGEAAPLYLANTLVRAVQLPAGENRVVFTFLPPDFLIGATISSIALLASLVTLVLLWQRGASQKRRQTPA